MRRIFNSIGVAIALVSNTALAELTESPLEQAISRAAGSATFKRLMNLDSQEESKNNNGVGKVGTLTGGTDPLKEIYALLEEKFSAKDEEENPRCLYPSKYYYLGEVLALPELKTIPDGCPKLKRWADIESIKEVQVLSISGYMGNPSSTFGHTLIRVQRKGEANIDPKGLLDKTVNYGAAIPPGEDPLSYVFKGLFGFYTASYSDEKFYKQDALYSHEEQRDIWVYDLNLSQREKEFLVLRMAELINQRFDYFFLSHNCALRIGELIDLVKEESFIPENPLWFTPVRLTQLIHHGKTKDGAPLSKKVEFIESQRGALSRMIKQLSDEEKKEYALVSNSTIKTKDDVLEITTSKKVVETALIEAQIRLKKDESEENKIHKEGILKARLSLPIGKAIALEKEQKESPAVGDLESRFLIKTNLSRKRAIELEISAFSQDGTSFHQLPGEGELRVATVKARAIPRPQLQKIEVLHVEQKTINDDSNLSKSVFSGLSWNFDIGAERENAKKLGYLRTGAGKTFPLSSSTSISLWAQVEARSQTGFEVYPRVSFVSKMNRDLKISGSLHRKEVISEGVKTQGAFYLIRKISKDSNLIGAFEKTTKERGENVFSLSLDLRN